MPFNQRGKRLLVPAGAKPGQQSRIAARLVLRCKKEPANLTQKLGTLHRGGISGSFWIFIQYSSPCLGYRGKKTGAAERIARGRLLKNAEEDQRATGVTVGKS